MSLYGFFSTFPGLNSFSFLLPFGLVFHVFASPSAPSFFWLLCCLLRYASLTIHWTRREANNQNHMDHRGLPLILTVFPARRCRASLGDRQAGLAPGGRGSLILHFTSPPVPTTGGPLTLGADLVGERDARQQQIWSLLQGSHCTPFLNPLQGVILPNPILLGSPLPSSLFQLFF